MQTGSTTTGSSSSDAHAPPVPPALDEIQTWIHDNKPVALLGAFAIGVFLGALVRR